MLDLTKVDEDSGSTGFVKSSGVDTVKLIRVGSQDRKAPSKAKALSITVDGGGKFNDTLYDFMAEELAPHYIKGDGTSGQLATRILGPLFTIVGTKDQTVKPRPVEGNNEFSDIDTFIALSGTNTTIKIAVQMQYSEFSRKMKPILLAVFNENGLSATELEKGITEPKQIKLYDNLQDKPTDKSIAEVSASAIQDAEDIFG